MAEAQAKMMSRQIELQQQVRERMVAVQVAQMRDLVKWYGAFLCIAAPTMILKARRSGNGAFAAPLLPLLFVFSYQLDFAYFTKVRDSACRSWQLEWHTHLPTPQSPPPVPAHPADGPRAGRGGHHLAQ